MNQPYQDMQQHVCPCVRGVAGVGGGGIYNRHVIYILTASACPVWSPHESPMYPTFLKNGEARGGLHERSPASASGTVVA